MTIRTKLTLWFVLAALLPAVVITFFAAGEATKRFNSHAVEELTQAEERGLEIVQSLKQEIAQRLRVAIESVETQEFLAKVTGAGEFVPDAYRFAEVINSKLALGFDFLQFLREDGIVISSLEYKEFAGNRDPFWKTLSETANGGVVVSPVRVGERDHLTLRALYRRRGITVVGGISLNEAVLPRFRASARAKIFLIDRVTGKVSPERSMDRKIAGELESEILNIVELPATGSTFSLASGNFFLGAVPLGNGNNPDGTILFLYPRKELDETTSGLLTTFILAAAVGLLLAFILGMLISRNVSRPLKQLKFGFDLVALGDFSIRLQRTGRDEIGKLFAAFNLMAVDLGRLREQLIRSERVAAWQEVARKIAHEIKNPLSPIQLSIETLRKVHERKHRDFATIFDESTITILEEVEKIRRIVQEFSDFARMPEPSFEPTNIPDVLGKVLRLLKPKLSGIELVEAIEDVPEISADAEQLHRLFLNVIANAIEALGGSGSISLKLERISEGEKRGGGWVRFTLEDDGPGMTEEVLHQLFTPYFTTKSEGMGLGLLIVQRIVEQHQGRLHIESTPGQGTSVTILLPLERKTAAPRTRGAAI